MSRKRPQPPVKPFKKKPNPLKAAKVTEIDYKDVALLRKFISDSPARSVPGRITGVTVQSSVSCPRRSRTPARWPCCRTPPRVAELGRL